LRSAIKGDAVIKGDIEEELIVDIASIIVLAFVVAADVAWLVVVYTVDS